MEAKSHINNYCKVAFALLLVLLIQIMIPVFSNVTFAASTKTGLKYVTEGGKVYIIGYTTKLGKNVTIPNQINGKNVVSISAGAFRGNKKMTSVKIPDTVETIATSAFKDCTNLQSVTISGSNLKRINRKAFYNCSSLAGFTMPDSVTSLGKSTFEDCSKLKTVKLSSGLTNIPLDCFYMCSSLTNITIPKGVINIEHSAFNSCKKLASVTFEKGSKLIAIGDYAFALCSSLKKMTVEGTKTTEDLVLPDTVSQIGVVAFGYTNFSTIIIPSGVAFLPSAVFQHCENLKEVYFYGTYSLGLGDATFKGCTKLTNVYATLKEVSDHAFYKCENLEKIYAASYLNLVESGDQTAFEGCNKLTVYSNTSLEEVITAGAQKNEVDQTEPKVKVTYSKNSLTNKDVTVTIESTDGELLHPIGGWKIDSRYQKLTKTYTANVDTKIRVADLVGNAIGVDVKITNIDKTAPKITINNTTGKNWKNKAQKVQVTANDKSGIKSLKIQKVGSKKEYTIKGSQGTVSLNKYGQYKVVAIDKAGNKKVSSTFWNYVDTDKPTITNVKAEASDQGKITATVTDKTSKIKNVKLIGNGKTYASKKPNAQGVVTFSVAKSGTYKLKATDNAGNIKTESIKITIPEKPEPPAEDPIEKEEEEDTTETPDIPTTEEDTEVDEGSVKDEVSEGEEEAENTKKEEITEEGDNANEGEDLEIPVIPDNNCTAEYDETNKTVEITKYTGTQDTLEIPEIMEKDGTQYTITKIATKAFENTGVKEVALPKTVVEIGENAFANCEYLEKVIIKNENLKIGNNAFTNNNVGIEIYSKSGSTAETFAKNNQILSGIYIEEGNFEYIIVDEIFQEVKTTSTENGEQADETTADDVTVEEKTKTIAEILKYNGDDEKLLVPSKVGEYNISSIGENAFKGNTNLKQIELLDNLRKIKTGAFEDCTNLNQVILRNKEISIGTDAFKNTKEDLTLYCNYDSTGMDYAKTNQKLYVLIHGAFMYQLNDDTKTADLLAARVGEGDPEYVTIVEDIGEYTLGSIKSGAFLNTQLKGVIVKSKTVPIEHVEIEPGALEGVDVGTLYCYEGSTADEYLKEHSELGIQVQYLNENGDIQPEEITTEEEELNIKVGEKDSILAQIYPSITTNKELNYKSNDENIVTVDEKGQIKGIGEGETTILVTSKVDDSKVVTIKIKVDYIKLTLKLNGGELNMQEKTYTDQVEVKVPYDYKIKDITNPSKYGYEFKGWYEETEEGEIAYIEDPEEETITQDITLCAGWEEIKPQESTNGDTTTADKILPNTGKATIIIGTIALIGTAIGSKIKIRKMERKKLIKH